MFTRQNYLLDISDTRFATDQEFYYFTWFQNHVVLDVAPDFHTVEWSTSILQACDRLLPVRTAAIALAALAKASQSSKTARKQKTASMPSVDVTREALNHHAFALRWYQKAIRSMRGSFEHENPSVRTIIIYCIITACFDSAHGDQDAATAQIRTGIMALKDWRLDPRKSWNRSISLSSGRDSLTVDDCLVQSMTRMETQLMAIRVPSSARAYVSLLYDKVDLINSIPHSFGGIENARKSLDLIVQRTMNFNRPPVPVDPESAQQLPINPISPIGPHTMAVQCVFAPPPESRMFPQGYTHPRNHFFDVSHKILNNAHLQEYPDMEPELAAHDAYLDTWAMSFTPLLKSSIESGGQEAIRSLTLWIEMYSAKLFRSFAFKSEMEYDAFFPHFQNIVSNASLLQQVRESLPHSHKSQSILSKSRLTSNHNSAQINSSEETSLGFSFELGILPALQMTAMKCRDGPVRREALRLMEKHDRREGIHDSHVMAGIARWVIGLEGQLESNANEEDVVPVERRTTHLFLDFDWLKREVYMRCLMPGSTGWWLMKAGSFVW
ncbi:hypothetical protein GLAREA_09195 [Glarea lozoyensis ATCC 20868]|uniref:Uncharacterized protein n=1 Tax=Glarea lozoyensis (strain ATCC 20868 / MF5171) TaxID=1116229 RepID=S3DF39_GLAL2|nr:uncharacterized protein GLAREA_09195 [Glarea lozoyensis ATCC 20868]EPE37032.1 hypothetical protein GLAREA_09195 [Glarea lozoyensis ATCC 20868]